jgi:hypothetical protein
MVTAPRLLAILPAENRFPGQAIVPVRIFIASVMLLIGTGGGAFAQAADFTGKWSFSGQIISGRLFYSFAQICDLKQTDDQLAGPCRGPNGGCSMVGVVNGANVDLTCRTSFTNNPGLAGVSTFHGTLGGDDIVRGSVTQSRAPGARGVAAMMRI